MTGVAVVDADQGLAGTAAVELQLVRRGARPPQEGVQVQDAVPPGPHEGRVDAQMVADVAVGEVDDARRGGGSVAEDGGPIKTGESPGGDLKRVEEEGGELDRADIGDRSATGLVALLAADLPRPGVGDGDLPLAEDIS